MKVNYVFLWDCTKAVKKTQHFSISESVISSFYLSKGVSVPLRLPEYFFFSQVSFYWSNVQHVNTNACTLVHRTNRFTCCSYAGRQCHVDFFTLISTFQLMQRSCAVCPRLYPRHASALNNLGTLTHSSEEAEHFYRRALDINPQHNRALFNLGNLLKYVTQTRTQERTADRFVYLYGILKSRNMNALFFLKGRNQKERLIEECWFSHKSPLSLKLIETGGC